MYYIKDKIVFSAETKKVELPVGLDDIQIPHETKNHLTNNKIVLSDLNKMAEKTGKEIFLTQKIDKYSEVRAKIRTHKNKLKKPQANDYDFIEKTSQLQIIEGVLKTYENYNVDAVKERVENYIKHTKEVEKEKITNLKEQIDIEKSKIEKIKKKKYSESSKIKELEAKIKELESRKLRLEKEEAELEKLINKSSVGVLSLNGEIERKINKINKEVKNNILEMKILKARSVSLKGEMRLGKTKCINWILFILTLGLIYWTKYSDCKYHLLRLEQKINKLNEKNLILEKKKYNLELEAEEEVSKQDKRNIENVQSEQQIVSKIDEIKIEIKEIDKKVEQEMQKGQEYEKELQRYSNDIRKIEDNLIELNTINEEFSKYSTQQIEVKLNEVVEKQLKKLEYIKDLKEAIEQQNIEIQGEWIYSG